jgi:hypothetical protein
MPNAMPRQKSDGLILEHADYDRGAGFSKRRIEIIFMRFPQPRHAV